MIRALAVGFGILILTGFGAGVTELSLAVGQQQLAEPLVTHRVLTRVSPAPKPTPSATPAPFAVPTPVPTPALRTAVTNGFVHLRASTSTASAALANLQGGTVLQLTGPAIGMWQPVRYGQLDGYVYLTYLNY